METEQKDMTKYIRDAAHNWIIGKRGLSKHFLNESTTIGRF